MSQPPSGVPSGPPWPQQPGRPFLQQTASFPPAGQTIGGFPPPPPPKKDRPVYLRPWFAVLALFLVVGVIGSALDGDDETSPVAAETSSASPSPQPVAPPTATVPPAPVAPTTTAAPPPAAPTTAAPTTTAPTTAAPTTVPPPPPAPVVDFAMPTVVGMDLQSAQNLIQTNGVFLSLSHDLLGSRNQVLDSNWIVCTQNIAPGQQVTGDVEGAIDLGVVKREESCP